MNISELRRLLEPYNPWRRRWYKHDPLLQNFYDSILKSEPRLYYHLRRHIPTPDNCDYSYNPYYNIIFRL